MKEKDVPQDQVRTYDGHKKVIYAISEQGEYRQCASSGWSTEEYATRMAVEELQQQAKDAYLRAVNGIGSPLEYYMYLKRMDVIGLAQATGLFQWQVRRHLKPKGMLKLSDKAVTKYQTALGIPAAQLRVLPEVCEVDDV